MKNRRLLGVALTCALVISGPGCVLGCPVAAFSGEPWGMTRDDLSALGGKKRGPIFGGNPILAAIDLPFSAVLDTALLPLSGLIWLIRLGFSSDGGDHHGADGHTHGSGEGAHTHDGEDHDHDHHAVEDPTKRPVDDEQPEAPPQDAVTTPPADQAAPAPKTRGHHHNDFVFRHHHGDGNFEHTHGDRHHHGDGNLEHDHGNGNTEHLHLSNHHHGDHDLDHHHGDGQLDHTHPLDDPNVLEPGEGR